MTAAQPVIDRAVKSLAPGAPPSLRSHAKILASKAIKAYDPKKGAKLQTHLYAQLQPLQREQASYSTVQVPERVRFDLSSLNRAHNQFVDEHGREPSDSELADVTKISERRLGKIRRYDKRLVGEGTLDGEDENSTHVLPSVSRAANLWSDYVYNGLSGQDKLIYDMKTGRNGRGDPLSVSDIARRLRISSSAVSQRLGKIAGQVEEGAKYGDVV
jgi:DNA-directed RNA polymerase specialized sigma subunit